MNSDPYYTSLLKERWRQYRRSNLSDEAVMATVDSLALVLLTYGAESRNSQAWPRWNKWVWPNYYTPKNYADELSYLKRWIVNRLAWMDEQLGYHSYNFLRGDVDSDGVISIADTVMMIDYLIGEATEGFSIEAADCDLDGDITIGDLTELLDYLLNGYWST